MTRAILAAVLAATVCGEVAIAQPPPGQEYYSPASMTLYWRGQADSAISARVGEADYMRRLWTKVHAERPDADTSTAARYTADFAVNFRKALDAFAEGDNDVRTATAFMQVGNWFSANAYYLAATEHYKTSAEWASFARRAAVFSTIELSRLLSQGGANGVRS